ncbi:MAG: glucose-6-phosphate isomerase [Ruminococcaceae bacterium]|nr:glucose-6-phosphate isomerase [Oscillospiraceae bacterium]
MTLRISDKFVSQFVCEKETQKLIPAAKSALNLVKSRTGAGNDYLGWYDLPRNYDKEEFARIKVAADKIRKNSDVLIVIGIGGSYLGARAAIEFVKSPLYNNLKKDTPDIYFAGNNISTTALNELLSICDGRDVSVNVISKSGTTTEPAIAFRVFKALLTEKYGEDGAKDRIFVTTDKARGTLKQFSDKAGYETFVVPDDVGGRYSVLTAVGLLPIAVAGIDIDAMMRGAEDAMNKYTSDCVDENEAMKYAIIRNALANQGKTTEILVGYEPYLLMLNEWWKQLYGESEGKENKGIFPASVIFSTDLHSLGQYIQEGQRNLFETVINVLDNGEEFVIPNDAANVDGLNFIAGEKLDFVNKTAMLATLIAHNDGGVPNILIELKDKSAYSFGYLVYFFELACAISGYMLGVNPFDQPGVEAYKKNMFALLGKPGYENMKAELEKRISEK